MTSLETRSVKRNTRTVANNRGTKGGKKKEALENGGERRRRKTWTRFNGAFKFFRFFLEGGGGIIGAGKVLTREKRGKRA